MAPRSPTSDLHGLQSLPPPLLPTRVHIGHGYPWLSVDFRGMYADNSAILLMMCLGEFKTFLSVFITTTGILMQEVVLNCRD